jgi:hypothetical protein
VIDFSKYKDKTILILGGGTSTLDTKWENLDYDYVWTCNEFYLEPRVLDVNIDLYILSHTVDLLNKKLLYKLKGSNSTVLLEPKHFRNKINTSEFHTFCEFIERPVVEMDLELPTPPAGWSGVTFRLILLALQTNAKQICFSGFDGFNKEFSNIHAFTRHPGLKDTDTRRTYEGTDKSYVTIFTEAFKYFLSKANYNCLQNLGEGFDYNIGTPISKEYFPLTKEVYDKIR